MQQGGAAYLRAKYPGLPTDAIAGKLCELAETYAAVAGGVSGAAASAAVLTAGMAIPAAISGVMAEVLYTVRLQLRLAYDLHLVYGVPLDANDPEELTRLFGVVYGVKAAELGGLGIKAYGPEVARAQLFRLIHGNTPMIQAAASQVLGPRIAKQITQKAIIKTAVPIVGTAFSAGWNYTTTQMMATRGRHAVRLAAALRAETQRQQGIGAGLVLHVVEHSHAPVGELGTRPVPLTKRAVYGLISLIGIEVAAARPALRRMLQMDLHPCPRRQRAPAVAAHGVQRRAEVEQALRFDAHAALHAARNRHGDFVDVDMQGLPVPKQLAGAYGVAARLAVAMARAALGHGPAA